MTGWTDWLRLRRGLAIRREACRLAAVVAAGNPMTGPRLWSLTVFFEEYMRRGATGTMANFGPTAPVNLEVVRNDRSEHDGA